MIPKYSELEIERRWLAKVNELPDLAKLEKKQITDSYVDGTRLRLRKVESPKGMSYKLCKKYGKISGISEPITNIYIDENEYAVFSRLEASILVRERYTYEFREVKFSINRIVDGTGPVIIEAEFRNEEEAIACTPPAFCGEEVSDKKGFEAINFASKSCIISD
ncbi:hypothetical protein C9I98_10410 [Photobacterium sanctipauli]|uniref:CYTH domain-containing protein n=1 Tax=Photobacterium sanctipauli TaxID=1342794 RepID=A0A2T3NUD3_9GAMM|nr:hypothetical protein [Photobacterium sanctipauli]PSW19867.1 hypothetical protein C9I98_10410 [Photobacterium sanctipauli]